MALVLVVDDECFVRMGAVQLVEQAGHQVIEAANADDAIRILESRTDVEIVLSDVKMPGSMDGLELIRVIRTRWPPIRLILTSGKALAAQSAMPLGSVFLSKPFAYQELAGALERAA